MEAPIVAGNVGVRPVHIGSLRVAIENIARQQLVHISLTFEASLTGDHKLALQTLLAHPTAPSMEVAEEIFDDFTRCESKHLPQFK